MTPINEAARGPHRSTCVFQSTELCSCLEEQSWPLLARRDTHRHVPQHRPGPGDASLRSGKASWFCHGKSILQPLPAMVHAPLSPLPSCAAHPISCLVTQVFVINFPYVARPGPGRQQIGAAGA